jgi:hypothetical protein
MSAAGKVFLVLFVAFFVALMVLPELAAWFLGGK